MLARAARGGANPPGRSQCNATHEATFSIIEIVEAVEEMHAVSSIRSLKVRETFVGQEAMRFLSVPTVLLELARAPRNQQVPAEYEPNAARLRSHSARIQQRHW